MYAVHADCIAAASVLAEALLAVSAFAEEGLDDEAGLAAEDGLDPDVGRAGSACERKLKLDACLGYSSQVMLG